MMYKPCYSIPRRDYTPTRVGVKSWVVIGGYALLFGPKLLVSNSTIWEMVFSLIVIVAVIAFLAMAAKDLVGLEFDSH